MRCSNTDFMFPKEDCPKIEVNFLILYNILHKSFYYLNFGTIFLSKDKFVLLRLLIMGFCYLRKFSQLKSQFCSTRLVLSNRHLYVNYCFVLTQYFIQN